MTKRDLPFAALLAGSCFAGFFAVCLVVIGLDVAQRYGLL